MFISKLAICRLGVVVVLSAGCQQQAGPAVSTAPASEAPATPVATGPTNSVPDLEPAPLPVISLGGAKPESRAPGADSKSSDASSDARQAAIAALQPLQSLLGKWRGITRKEVSDFKGIESPEWVWDLRTERLRPALLMASPTGVYYRELRLTGAGEPDKFRLIATDAEGRQRTLEGTLAEPVEQFQEGGTILQNKFKLLFEETGEGRDRWQLAIAQQNNDRYLVELSRIRPTGIQRIDTIGHQREGTSVAKSDTDFGERKCIISGGLGTISLSYKGKTYWVCCTGCQAAFNEDPEGWLRDAAKKAMP